MTQTSLSIAHRLGMVDVASTNKTVVRYITIRTTRMSVENSHGKMAVTKVCPWLMMHKCVLKLKSCFQIALEVVP